MLLQALFNPRPIRFQQKQKPKRTFYVFISSVTKFEVIDGATEKHLGFLNGMLPRFTVLDFDSKGATNFKFVKFAL